MEGPPPLVKVVVGVVVEGEGGLAVPLQREAVVKEVLAASPPLPPPPPPPLQQLLLQGGLFWPTSTWTPPYEPWSALVV